MASPQVGDKAPDFTLRGTAGPVTLSEVVKDKHVVLTTYRMDFTGDDKGG
jgi:peroxiredoxin